MVRGKFRATLISVSLASLMLRWFVSPAPIWYSPHDDLLMVRLAAQIRAGNWLGDYSELGHLTLAKPAGYPLFLASTHFLPWAPTVTVHLMVLAGLLLICRELRRAGAPRALVAGFFVSVAFFPPFFGNLMSRIYREGLLVGLSFVAVGLSAHLGHLLADRRPMSRRGWKTIARTVGTAFVLGLVLSFVMVTKPGWYPLALLCAGFCVRSFVPPSRAALRSSLGALAATTAVLIVGLSTITGYVTARNNDRYGVATLEDFTTGGYAEVLRLWSSVETENPRPYVLVDATQRELVYGISDTARELRPYLEVQSNVAWRGVSCKSVLKICDESSAWFPWELRDAAESAFPGGSARSFDTIFRQIAADISDACADDRIPCGALGVVPGLPSLGEISPRLFVDAFAAGLGIMADPSAGTMSVAKTGTDNEDLVDFWKANVRGLPDGAPRGYGTDALRLVDIVRLLDTLYGALWIPMIAAAGVGYVLRGPRSRVFDSCRLLGALCLLSTAAGIASIALLEAGNGTYMTEGGRNYLLPSYVPFFGFVLFGLLRLTTRATRSALPSDEV